MKITKSMIYRPTAESQELYLYADNSATLYRHAILPAIENLQKKVKKGIYDADKATVCFFNIMTQASNEYKREFGYAFDVTARWTAAQDMRDYIAAEYLG